MTARLPRACAVPGCPNTSIGSPRCSVHTTPKVDPRPNSRARGYDHSWEKTAAAVRREEPWCRLHLARNQKVSTAHVDHIVPRARGGTDDRSNLQGLCSSCHSSKTVREDGGFGRPVKR